MASPKKRPASATKSTAKPKRTNMPGGVSLHDLVATAERERTVPSMGGPVVAHFGELRAPLLRFIDKSDVLVGCVAWITSPPVLSALASKHVALVVQKESWWKKNDARGIALADRYNALRGDMPARAFPEPLSRRRTSTVPAIACLGYGDTKGGRPGGATPPLMHHKFLIRCTVTGKAGAPDSNLEPVAVWTGSFNFSGNANDSLENAVEIHDPVIAAAYLSEFAAIARVAEPMTWRLGKPAGTRARTSPDATSPAEEPTLRSVPRAVPRPAKRPKKPAATTTRTVTGAGKKKAAAKKTGAKTGTGTPARNRTAKKAA